MKIVMLDAKTLGDDLDLSLFKKLGDFTAYPMTEDYQVKYRIQNADVIITNKIKLNRENLHDTKNLRLICVTATGFDNIDVNYCWRHEIGVCNVKGYSTDSVAQVTVSMALSLVTHLREYDNYVKKDYQYLHSGLQNHLEPVFHEISGMTWGVVGLGNIGKKVLSIANALGAEGIAYTRTRNPIYNCVPSVNELCRRADIISIHVPLTDKTYKMIGSEQIALMKKTAVVINTARGAVVDERALTDAVIEKRIGGIGIDVYTEEPIHPMSPYNSILDLDNVIFTPHMAWGAYESRVRCMKEIYKNIQAFQLGQKRNRVDK